MKQFISTISAIGAVSALAAGCAYDHDMASNEESVGSEEALACENPDGTNAMIAGLATVIGRELHRWEITKDFEVYRGYQNQEMLRLTTTGKAQCANQKCTLTEALLAFQDSRLDQQYTFPGGVKLSSWSYAARLTAGYGAQKTCEQRPANNHQPNTCPAEAHYLTQLSSVPGGCAQMVTFQHAKSNGGAPLQYADQLINKLLWAGGKENPYLLFAATGTTVEIDPTYGIGDVVPTNAAGCLLVCNNTIIEGASVTGACCSCNGVNGKMKAMPLNNQNYKCQ